jgi:hypothetical protein
MTFTKLGGAIFAVGLVVIVLLAIFVPIICGVSAGCGSASW